MDLGDRLIKLANKLLSAGSSETLGTQGGITDATANDILVPTSKAVKDYVDGKTIELITTTNTSDEELAATSTTLSEVKDGTMILLKVINPFTRISADCALTLTLKNGEVLGGKLINHPDSPTGILHSNIVPPNTIFLMRYNGLRWDIIDQYNLATQSFRGFMSTEDKTKLDNTYTKTEIDALNASKVDKVTGKGLSTNDFTNTHKNGLEFLMNSIVSEEVYFTTEQVPQSQFMVGSYSNQRLGSAILENKLLFQRFGIGAGGSILLYNWDTDREEVDLPASLKNIVKNKQSQISYSNSNLILELINNNTQLQIRNTGTTSIANGSISYNEE